MKKSKSKYSKSSESSDYNSDFELSDFTKTVDENNIKVNNFIDILQNNEKRILDKKKSKSKKVESSDDSLSDDLSEKSEKSVKVNKKVSKSKNNYNHLLDENTRNLLKELPENYLEEAQLFYKNF